MRTGGEEPANKRQSRAGSTAGGSVLQANQVAATRQEHTHCRRPAVLQMQTWQAPVQTLSLACMDSAEEAAA